MITPMFNRLRRWHFDLTFFLGVALFGIAYYLSIPWPVWSYLVPRQNPKQATTFKFLGFSQDDSCLYTCDDTKALPGHLPTPTIQRWETSTGKCLETYPLQVPEADRLLLKKHENNVRPSEFKLSVTSNPKIINCTLDLFSPTDRDNIRLYQIEDGACVTDPLPIGSYSDQFFYLMQNPHDGHHLVAYTTNTEKGQVHIADLTTGQVLKLLDKPKPSFFMASTTPDRQFLVLSQFATDQQNFLDVYRMSTWEKVVQFKLHEGFFQQLAYLDDTHWVVMTTISLNKQSYDRMRLDFYRFDPAAGTLTPDPTHPLQEQVYGNGINPRFQGSFFYLLSVDYPMSHYFPAWQRVEDWVARVGINIKRPRKMNYHLHDIHTGQLLRQLNGLPEAYYQLSHQGHCLAGLERKKGLSNNEEVILQVYALPHYLWQPTLSWMQWPSWLLVIPWPLRYAIALRQNPLVPNTTA